MYKILDGYSLGLWKIEKDFWSSEDEVNKEIRKLWIITLKIIKLDKEYLIFWKFIYYYFFNKLYFYYKNVTKNWMSRM